MNVSLLIETNGLIEDVVVLGTYGREALHVAIPRNGGEVHATLFSSGPLAILHEDQRLHSSAQSLRKPLYLWTTGTTKIITYID